MSQVEPSAPQRPERVDRSPAMTLAIAFGSGITVDRWGSLSWSVWLAAAGMATVTLAFCIGLRRGRVAAWVAAMLFVALGGARHHEFWSLRPLDDIRQYARAEPQLVELTGVVRSPVEIVAAKQDALTPDWMRVDQSRCTVAVESLASTPDRVAASGLVQLQVAGHLLHARSGDRIRVVGTLSLPGPVRNPGAFDYRGWLRGDGIDCIVRCDFPDAVTTVEPASGWRSTLGRWRDGLRREILDGLQRELSVSNAPVAASLLLGDRTGMSEEISDAYVESGTMHLLAISGLHVAMLAGMVYVVCRMFKLSPASAGCVVLLLIVGYAFLTDHQPSVVRSAILAGMVAIAGITSRNASSLNTLACSALVVLLWNPADLFDIGAQLSFLAVVGILCGVRWSAATHILWRDPYRADRTAFQNGIRWCGRRLVDAWIVTAAIWLFTLPITLWTFHLASPIGFIVNVLLVPWSAMVLAAGFSLTACLLLLPQAGFIPGTIFEWSLSVLNWLVSMSAATPLGHFHVAGPSGGWLAGWYALLAVGSGLIRIPISTRRAWQGLGLWTVLGLMAGWLEPRPDGLTCTVLSVGHGGAVLMEMPGGRTLLYDVGAFGSPERAERITQQALWAGGQSQVDALLISHADSDHYNGASGLLRSTRVASLLLSQSALDFRQSGIAQLCDDASQAGTDVRLVWSGDRLKVDPEVEIEVVHPQVEWNDDDDNANSLVLRVRYAGRSLLLTGDLEGSGLQALLASPREDVDILLAPHHGAVDANPPELSAWCRPGVVVASTGDQKRTALLQEVYGPDCVVLSTADSGAVSIHVGADGEITTHGFLDERRIE